MYPKSKQAALLQQLETEQAIEDLVEIALGLWLPIAEADVLRAAAPPPDPEAVGQSDAQWDYLLEAVVILGLGYIAAYTAGQAYETLAGVPMAAAEASASVAEAVDLPGLPTRETLRERVSRVLSRRLRVRTADVESQLATTPALREFVNDYRAGVRDRIADVVGRAYRRLRGIADETPEVEVAREEVAPVFDPLDEQWAGVIREIGQTQATSTLNAAVEFGAEQAAASGSAIEREWVAIIDTHTRAAHEIADGQVRPLGQMFDVGGEQLRWPGDFRASYDNTVNCRCRTFAYLVGSRVASGKLIIPDKIREFAEAHAGKPYVWGGGDPDYSGFMAALHASLGKADADPAARMANESSADEETPVYRSFTSVLAVIGEETDDGRMFAEDIALTFRDFPLPLMWCKQNAGGHYDAYTVGVIESAEVSGTQVIGTGYMLRSEEALEAIEQIEHGVTGPSVDLGSVEWELRDEKGNAISEEEWWDLPDDAKLVQTVLAAKVLAATLVSTPAFGSTSITLGEEVERGEEALVAAAAAPLPGYQGLPTYNPEFFTDPKFAGPTLPHMTADGRIQGHLAAWNVCHVGIQDACVLAPHSAIDYAMFHTAPPVRLDGGGTAKVGRLTTGCGHADGKLSLGATIAHYDNAGNCFALVHVGEDEHGVWFSGVPAPGVTPEQLAQGLAAPLSGDWRRHSGNLELVAALSVNTPGFPIVASGATNELDEPISLIASLGPCPETADGPQHSEEQLRVFARVLLEEQRMEAARAKEARALLDRAEALDLIGKVTG
jgi:hypothetical protein